MLLGTLAVSILGNALAGVIKTGQDAVPSFN